MSTMPASDPDYQPPTQALPKPFSLSLSAPKSKSKRPSHNKPFTITSHDTTAPARPIHTSLHDSDDEPDDSLNSNNSNNASAELVSAFDSSAGGAISVHGTKDESKRQLVIVAQKNRDWREESRRKRGGGRDLLPAEVRAARQQQQQQQQRQDGGKGAMEVVNGGVQAYGLIFVKAQQGGGGMAKIQLEGAEEEIAKMKVKTDDELALEALLGSDGRKSSTMVLPAVEASLSDEDNIWGSRAGSGTNGINEDDAFRSDVASRPDSSSLDDYAAVPVEEFGAALLRGMGWKEGEVVGKRKDQVSKPRILEPRPALLGIGAKEVPGGVGDEIGAWGRAAASAKGKRRVVDKTYNPVLLRNSKTGEMVTEEELRAKKEEQQRKEKEEEEGWRQRRDRNLTIDQEKKKRSTRSRERYRNRDHDDDRDRDRNRRRTHRDKEKGDYDSSRSTSSRRPRSQSPERRQHQRKHYDESYDSRDRRRARDTNPYDSNSSSRRDRRDQEREKERERYDSTSTSRRNRQEVY